VTAPPDRRRGEVAPLLAQVVRSGFVESAHRGALIALRPDRSTVLSRGEVDRPVLPRSSNKPLQAVGLLELGWQPAAQEHLALAVASHSGEPQHLDVVRALLASAGLTEQSLANPAMPPLGPDAAAALLRSGAPPTRLTMNCSGKHAAMLAACVQAGWSTSGYLAADHRLQLGLRPVIERLAGEPVSHVAIDGCGAPAHALTVRGLAAAFLRLVQAAPGSPERSVADAARAHPWLVGGTGRDVTRLMQAVPGALAKDGAEGVYAVAVPDVGAVAVKIEDGSQRARLPVLVAGLRALGLPAAGLDDLAGAPVLGGGEVVGAVRATV